LKNILSKASSRLTVAGLNAFGLDFGLLQLRPRASPLITPPQLEVFYRGGTDVIKACLRRMIVTIGWYSYTTEAEIMRNKSISLGELSLWLRDVDAGAICARYRRLPFGCRRPGGRI
jgi:hypothetical protein